MRITMRTNWAAWLVLVALAAASFGLSYAGLGRAGPPVAFGIAALKAATIAVIFMRAADQPGGNLLAVAVALLLVALLIGMVLADRAVGRPPAQAHAERGARSGPS